MKDVWSLKSAAPSETKAPLAAIGLAKSYKGIVALKGIDLELSQGQILSLVGPNGAGKSTLLSILAGLRQPDSGRLWINGFDTQKHPVRARAGLGVAPQSLGVYPTLTVRENLEFFGRLSGARRTILRRRVREAALSMSLDSVIDRPARLLSGGERRRLHTALAFVNKPQLVLLDEPLSGMDPNARNRTLELVRSIAREGAAVLYSSQYLPEIEQLDGTVAIINRGQILAEGSPERLKERYGKSTITLSFHGNAPRLNRHGVLTAGSTLEIRTKRPTSSEAAAILVQLGEAIQRLRGIELEAPSLESAYLQVTELPLGKGHSS